MTVEHARRPIGHGLMKLDDVLKILEPISRRNTSHFDAAAIRRAVNHVHEAKRLFEASLRLLDAPGEPE